uniref:Uncharacterized protein n=1 Tax=Onchocerca volvulus TaxID=6282 RepID=A0A8R1Y4F6_ONCVO
ILHNRILLECKAKSDKEESEKISIKQNDECIHRLISASSSAKRKRSESKLLNFNERYGYRTFSTFTPSEQEELQREASYIYDGAIFRRYCFSLE